MKIFYFYYCEECKNYNDNIICKKCNQQKTKININVKTTEEKIQVLKNQYFSVTGYYPKLFLGR